MVSIIEAIVLSVIQGITEWFPVSSSGHLAIFQNIFGFSNLPYLVFLHFASLLAVFVVFFSDIVDVFRIRYREDIDYLIFILIAIIPAGLVGIFFKDFIEDALASFFYLGIFFILSGVVIFLTKFISSNNDMTFFDSFVIGLFQALAIFPGVSRSGMTISSGLFRGLSREKAISFSFIVSIPLILGASIMELPSLFDGGIDYLVLAISFIVTFLVSLVVIKLLIRIVKSNWFWVFGIYDILLGIVVLVWSLI